MEPMEANGSSMEAFDRTVDLTTNKKFKTRIFKNCAVDVSGGRKVRLPGSAGQPMVRRGKSASSDHNTDL